MRQVVLLALAALAACTVSSDPIAGPPPAPISTNAADSVVAPVSEQPTRILSQRDADRLLGNTGLTLQWIGWERRGPVSIAPDDRGVWHVRGAQTGSDGGELEVDGIITETGEGYFILRGTVAITDTPDPGRECRADKSWRFAITQNRQYYRLREFEWCDGLTDYVDIYF